MKKLPYNTLRKNIIRKDEDEPKRDKRKCVYYDNGDCSKKCDCCFGSAHCTSYTTNRSY